LGTANRGGRTLLQSRKLFHRIATDKKSLEVFKKWVLEGNNEEKIKGLLTFTAKLPKSKQDEILRSFEVARRRSQSLDDFLSSRLASPNFNRREKAALRKIMGDDAGIDPKVKQLIGGKLSKEKISGFKMMARSKTLDNHTIPSKYFKKTLKDAGFSKEEIAKILNLDKVEHSQLAANLTLNRKLSQKESDAIAKVAKDNDPLSTKHVVTLREAGFDHNDIDKLMGETFGNNLFMTFLHDSGMNLAVSNVERTIKRKLGRVEKEGIARALRTTNRTGGQGELGLRAQILKESGFSDTEVKTIMTEAFQIKEWKPLAVSQKESFHANWSSAAFRRETMARAAVGRDLSDEQLQAVFKAHEVGRGQLGKDGKSFAQLGNYTPAQLREKTKILREAGLDQKEVRKLMENGVVGITPSRAGAKGQSSVDLILGRKLSTKESEAIEKLAKANHLMENEQVVILREAGFDHNDIDKIMRETFGSEVFRSLEKSIPERLSTVSSIVGRKMSPKENEAIIKALRVTTPYEAKIRSNILKEAGFSDDEIEKIVWQVFDDRGYLVGGKNLSIPVRRTASSSPQSVRGTMAKEVLGKELSDEQAQAVFKAHEVGAGKIGKDGKTLARVGNYTQAQLREKTKILREAGFDQKEVRKLMEKGVVGIVDMVRSFKYYRRGGDIRQMSPKEISKLPNNILWSLEPHQIQSLSLDQVSALRANQLTSMEPEQVRAFSPEQISSIDPDSLSYVGRNFTSYLTSDQVRGLTSTQIDYMHDIRIMELGEKVKFLNNSAKDVVRKKIERAPVWKGGEGWDLKRLRPFLKK
ncbi:MAG: hypothetical protein OXB88_04930, partial [Bacteriovoracales bacterium]|nr:hypothetical protein [Bacteriovoracales bacterium]